MNAILGFFRNTLSGTYYVIYCLVLLTFLFAIVGYLYKQKYAKVEFKLTTSQPKKEVVKAVDKKASPKKVKNKNVVKKETTRGQNAASAMGIESSKSVASSNVKQATQSQFNTINK